MQNHSNLNLSVQHREMLSRNAENVPDELKRRRCWMGTRPRPRQGQPEKLDKPPYRVVPGKPVCKADKTDSENWATFTEALDALKRGVVDAIGYVFTVDDPYHVIDLDDCVDPDTGEIDPIAAGIIHACRGTYVELSYSGEGVHIVGVGNKPDFAGCKSRTLGITVEVYDSASFVVPTGQRIGEGVAALDRQGELNDLCRKLWPRSDRARERQGQRSHKRQGERQGDPLRDDPEPVDLSDTELLERARHARSGAKFRRLFDAGDTSGYASASEADYALLNSLVFWTAADRERIMRLFTESALYRGSGKEGKHRDYVRRSVDKALASYVGPFYKPKAVSKARREAREDASETTDPLM